MLKTLTVKGVEAARAGDHTIKGRRGLILRIDQTGRRVWRLRGTLQGKARIWTIGEHPRLAVSDVSKLHSDCRHALDHGEDPQPLIDRWHLSAIPGAGTASGPTVADVMKEFMLVASRKRKRPEAAQALIDADVLPWIGDVSISTLRKRHFVELLDRIVRRGSPVQANRVQALLKQAFTVAADRDLIDSVPAMPRAPAGGDEKARERVLDDAELVAFWRGVDRLSPIDKRPKVGRPLALALKLLLVTGQRRGELAGAKWADIVDAAAEIPDAAGKLQRMEFKVWNIPTTKTDKPHAIPLSPLAWRLFEELRSLVPKDAAECFPSKRTERANAERDRSFTRAARTVREELRMDDWTPHDLRRTARTGLARIGISDTVAERILNHAAGDRMTAVYNRHGYLVEMKGALDAWALRIEALDAEAPK